MDRLKDRTTITMPPDIKKKLETLAKRYNKSKSKTIHFLIEYAYKNKNIWIEMLEAEHKEMIEQLKKENKT